MSAPKQSIGFRLFWPTIDDSPSARRAALNGVGIAAFCSAATALFAATGWLGYDKSSFFDAFVFACIAWGIFKMSRIAAVIGLSLYLLERVYEWTQPWPQGHHLQFVGIFYTLLFTSGVRGTFAYQRFKRLQTPGTPDSAAKEYVAEVTEWERR